MKKTFAIIVLLAALPQISFAGSGKNFQRIIQVVLENAKYENALSQPFISSLANRGALFTNFHAEGRPSQPNYIAMVAGSTHGVDTNQNVNLNVRHLGDLLEEKGLDWRGYADQYPGNCFLGRSKGTYVRKHMPFLSFVNVQRNPARCAKVVNGVQFDLDVAAGRLPDFSFYVPDLNNDGHDSGVTFADRWLREKFGKILNDPTFMEHTLFVLTFDEDDNNFGGGRDSHVLTLMIGPMVRSGVKNGDRLSHYSLLKLIEDNWQLGNLSQEDSRATPIQGVFLP